MLRKLSPPSALKAARAKSAGAVAGVILTEAAALGTTGVLTETETSAPGAFSLSCANALKCAMKNNDSRAQALMILKFIEINLSLEAAVACLLEVEANLRVDATIACRLAAAETSAAGAETTKAAGSPN